MRLNSHLAAKNTTRRIILGIAAGFSIFLLGIGLAWLYADSSKVAHDQKPSPVIKPKVANPSYEVKFAAMGDMLAHDSVVAQAKKGDSYDFTSYFQNIRPLYNDADVVFCNPETPSGGSVLGVSGYPTFNAPTEFARDLSGAAGCSLINLATNHMFDKGQAGIDETRATWSALKPLAVSGANSNTEQQNAVSYFEKNGVKIAFVAFADFSNRKDVPAASLNLYHDKALVSRLLTEARANADAVIVSAHWGTEDSTVVNADQTAAAELFASLGADVVIGTGPHVLQKVSYITAADGRRTLVWYSLGNMLSSQLQINELTGGIARFTIRKQQSKVAVDTIRFDATFMSYDWSASDRAMERLSSRTNLRLDPLLHAKDRISTMFPDASLDERRAFIEQTLGNEIGTNSRP